MDIVEFALKFKDMGLADLKKFGDISTSTMMKAQKMAKNLEIQNQKAGKSYDNLTNKASVFGSALSQFKQLASAAGMGVGFYQIGSMMNESVEKAHEIHTAEAQIRAGLLSTGQAAGVAFSDIEEVSNKLASSTLYSKGQLMDMQSILLTFPDVNKKIYGPASQAIADMSARMHQDLKSSAVEVGKALQDPITGAMALRRIGVNFTKEQVRGMADLVKSGHKYAAQQRILTELQNEFGGSAKAAFDADPLAKYNKMIDGLKVGFGDFVIKIQTYLMPVLIVIADSFKTVFHFARYVWDAFKEGNPIVLGLATLIGALIVGIAAYNIVQTVSKMLTVSWWVAQLGLNTAMLASPVTWIVAGIIALIAVIGIIIYKVDGWGKTWHNLIEFLRLGTNAFVVYFQLKWLTFQNTFMSGLEMIEKGWYRIKSLWDKNGASEGLAEIEKNRNDRLQQIAASQGKMQALGKQMSDMKVWELKWNDKKPADIVKGIKKGIGIPTGNTNADLMGTNAALGQSNANAGTANEKAITSGGPKVVNITVQKFLDNINIHSQNLKEGAADIEQKMLEMFSRVLAQGATTAQ